MLKYILIIEIYPTRHLEDMKVLRDKINDKLGILEGRLLVAKLNSIFYSIKSMGNGTLCLNLSTPLVLPDFYGK